MMRRRAPVFVAATIVLGSSWDAAGPVRAAPATAKPALPAANPALPASKPTPSASKPTLAPPKPGTPQGKPPSAPQPASGATAADADAALKAAFEALPEGERRAVQEALIWVGDFNSIVTGGYGPRTRDALAAYSKGLGKPPATLLGDKSARARMLAAAVAARAAVGFSPVEDRRSGVALSLPLKLLPRRSEVDAGSRFASDDGAAVSDTFSRPAGDGGLTAIYDRLTAPAPGRTITYKLIKPDFFVVTGETEDRKFYSRYALGSDPSGSRLVRGFTLAYPKSDAKRLDRIVLATAASFKPFPDTGSAVSAQTETRRPTTVQGVLLASGLVAAPVSQAQCPAPDVAGAKASYKASDEENGLALLEIPSRSAGSAPLADGLAPEASYFALFNADEGLTVAPAVLDEDGKRTSVNAPLQDGAAGAAIITRTGRLVGVTRAAAKASTRINGTVLSAGYPLVGPDIIRALVAKGGASPSTPQAGAPPDTLSRVVAAWRPMLVTIGCAPAGSGPSAPTR